MTVVRQAHQPGGRYGGLAPCRGGRTQRSAGVGGDFPPLFFNLGLLEKGKDFVRAGLDAFATAGAF